MKLPVVSGEKAIKAFLHAGFVKVRQLGSHVRLEKIEGNDIIKLAVPLHNPMVSISNLMVNWKNTIIPYCELQHQ